MDTNFGEDAGMRTTPVQTSAERILDPNIEQPASCSAGVPIIIVSPPSPTTPPTSLGDCFEVVAPVPSRLAAPSLAHRDGMRAPARATSSLTVAASPLPVCATTPTHQYTLDIDSMISREKLATLSPEERLGVDVARGLYRSDLSFMASDIKAQVLSWLRPALKNDADYAEIERFHLPRQYGDNPVRFAFECEYRPQAGLSQLMAMVQPRPDGTAAPEVPSRDQWQGLSPDARAKAMVAYFEGLQRYSREHKDGLLKSSATHEFRKRRIDPFIERERPTSLEIKTEGCLESLDQLYSSLEFAYSHFGSGAYQVHVSFAGVGRSPAMANDILSTLYFINLCGFLSQAGNWSSAFTYPWLQMPTAQQWAEAQWLLVNNGRADAVNKSHDQRQKYILASLRGGCYGGDNDIQGAELRRVPEWIASNGEVEPYAYSFGRHAEMVSDMIAAGGLPAELSQQMKDLPPPRSMALGQIGDPRVERILAFLSFKGKAHTLMQGKLVEEGFGSSVAYGPWFPWDRLPFVPESARMSIRARSEACTATIESMIDEAQSNGTAKAIETGDAIQQELCGFMKAIYENDGVRDAMGRYLNAMATTLHRCATSPKCTPCE